MNNTKKQPVILPPPPPENRRINEDIHKQWLVTFFKGVAICMIIFVHSSQYFLLPAWAKKLPQFGQMGCQIFFVLSAYTLCLSLEKNQTKTLPFLKRRIFRILPSYWTMIVVYVVYRFAFRLFFNFEGFSGNPNFWEILANVFFIHGLIPGQANNYVVRGGWFVGTLIIFYCFTPLLFKLFNVKNAKWQKNRTWLFPVAALTFSLCMWLLIGQGRNICTNNSFVYFSFINQFPCYALGFSLYAIKKCDFSIKPVFFALLFFANLAISIILFYTNLAFSFVFIPAIFSLSFVFLFQWITALAKNETPNIRLFRWINNMGERSFSVFLSHTLIVYDGVFFGKAILKALDFMPPDLLLYILSLPFLYVIVYWVGSLFDIYDKKLARLWKK